MKYNNFSVLFKQYIHNSQLSISSLAKLSGINRTLIQKYISGNRLPQNYSIVEKIIQFLALTQLQKAELKHSYKLEKIGYERFNKLLSLKNIILDLENNQSSFSSFPTYLSKEISSARNIHELKYLTQYILNNMDHTNDTLQILLNTDNQLFPIIFQFSKLFSHIKINLFLHFETLNNNNLSNNNLIQFKNIIPLIKINKNINIYYTYIDNPTDYSLYPFLISTSNFLLFINGNINSGILLKDNYLIQNEFNTKLLSTKHLIKLAKNNLEYQQNSLFFNMNSHSVTYYSGNPYIIPWIDINILEQHYIGSNNDKKQLIDCFLSFQNQIKKYIKKNKIHFYCYLSNFENISSDIYLTGISQELFKPFTKDELIQFYNNMLYSLEKENNYIFQIIDDKKIIFPLNLNIQIYQNNIIITNKDCSFNILEETLYQDFHLLSQIFEELEECIFNNEISISLLKWFI
uniref:hypothetical protein n=1 Tax=Thomasclavelia cocleata TaxID=69824 RepID=UPI00255AC776